MLFEYVAKTQPEVYAKMKFLIQPHSLDAVLPHFQKHLEKSLPNLHILNERLHKIPDLCFQFVRAIRIPTPGDAFGIQLTCRLTKADTQGTLDSKHLQSCSEVEPVFNVDRVYRYELQCFNNHVQIFEMAPRRGYGTIFTHHHDLIERLPEAGLLEYNGPCNKAKTKEGFYKYLNHFPYIIVHDKVVYQKTMGALLHRLSAVEAFSDIRLVFQKCGLVSYFFNVARVVKRQLVANDVYYKDVMTVVKYQCRSGRPLPLTREGLVRNPERSPIEILSFEAPKKNMALLCTEGGEYAVEKSAEKILLGQQFNEGTGFFAIKQDGRTLAMPNQFLLGYRA